MSQAATALAAAAALGAASEATGTTAFTPLGQQAREQQGGGGGGRPPAFPSAPGGVSEDVLGQLAESFRQQQAGTSVDLDLGGLGQQAGAGAGTTMALEELRRRLEDQQQRTRDWRERFEERVDETTDAGGDGDGGLSLPEWLLEQQRDDPSSDDSGSDPDDFKLQDLEGRGPYGVGTGLAAGGEIGAATGGTIEKSVGGLTKVGNTYSQVARALAGKEYSAEDTLAEDIHGAETRRINWGDYNPLSGGDGSSRTSKNNGENAKRNRDEPEVFGFGGGVEAIDPLGNFRDDSSSESEESVVSLPDELKERLEGPTDLPAGGL